MSKHPTKTCRKIYNRRYYCANRKKIKANTAKWQKKYKKKTSIYKSDWYARQLEKYPWYNSYISAKTRCDNVNHKCYHRYGGRGIKFLLTHGDFAFLWKRDKAYLMKRPSIDRIDNDKNYVRENCQFIEFHDNAKQAWTK